MDSTAPGLSICHCSLTVASGEPLRFNVGSCNSPVPVNRVMTRSASVLLSLTTR